MNDWQLMHEFRIYIEEENIDKKLDALKKYISNFMTLLFRLINLSPYFDKTRLRCTNHT